LTIFKKRLSLSNSDRLDICVSITFFRFSLEDIIMNDDRGSELVDELYDNVHSWIKTAWPVILFVAIMLFLAA